LEIYVEKGTSRLDALRTDTVESSKNLSRLSIEYASDTNSATLSAIRSFLNKSFTPPEKKNDCAPRFYFQRACLRAAHIMTVLIAVSVIAGAQSNDFPATFRHVFASQGEPAEIMRASGQGLVVVRLYSSATSSTALWQEASIATPTSDGNFEVLIGSNTSKGLPTELFAHNEILWVGVQVGNTAESKRTSLVGVPYSIKARDSEYLGGLPASSYLSVGQAIGGFTNPLADGSVTTSAIADRSVTAAKLGPDVQLTANINTKDFLNKSLVWNNPQTFKSNGTFDSTSMSRGVTSILNGCDPSIVFHSSQGIAKNASEAVTGCVDVPASATTYQTDAVAGYVVNNGTFSNAVGGYFYAQQNASGGYVWGVNPAAVAAGGATNVHLQNEFDLIVQSGATGANVIGVNVQAPIWNEAPESSIGVNIGRPGGTANTKWGAGFTTQAGAAFSALLAGPLNDAPNSSSQAIVFRSYDRNKAQVITSITGTFSGGVALNTSSNYGNIQITTDSAGGGLFMPGGAIITHDGNIGGKGGLRLITANNQPLQLNPVGSNVNISGGVQRDGSGVKHRRFGSTTLTAASAFTVSTTTYSWGSPFPDANYTVVCQPAGAAVGSPIWQGVIAFDAGTVTVQHMSAQAVKSAFSGVSCIALHN
jgi:hypothetical protein